MLSGTRASLARLAAVLVALLLISAAVVDATADDRTRQSATVSATVPPARVARPHPGSVFVVGDSLTVGIEPWLGADLRHRGWHLAGIDARVGRPVAEGLQVLRAHGASLPHTVVIALGTNDLGAGRATVTDWLRSARAILGHRRIIWVNLCLAAGADPRLASYKAINATLSRLAPRYNVHVADWCAYAHAHGVTPGPDHIHYASAGYQKRASFYAAAISQ